MKHTKWIIKADDRDYIEFGLTQGQVGIIDRESEWVLDEYNFHAIKNKDNYYIYYGTKLLHRLLMDFPDGLEVDHKNNNTLDNRLANLRVVNRSLNQRNGDDKKNKFGLMGVQYRDDGRHKRFYCTIYNNNGIRENKSFSVNKYGYDNALQLAKDWIMARRGEYNYFKNNIN